MKPFYVDFASPVSVDVLAKIIRRGAKEDAATPMTVTEMLPNPRQCWLTDAQGNRYASELRIVTLNPEFWRPPGPMTELRRATADRWRQTPIPVIIAPLIVDRKMSEQEISGCFPRRADVLSP